MSSTGSGSGCSTRRGGEGDGRGVLLRAVFAGVAAVPWRPARTRPPDPLGGQGRASARPPETGAGQPDTVRPEARLVRARTGQRRPALFPLRGAGEQGGERMAGDVERVVY